jgi:DNA repair protein REV1
VSCDEAYLDISADVQIDQIPTVQVKINDDANDAACFDADTDDESCLDHSTKPTAAEFVAALRQDIFNATQLHASAGIAHNMLLARMCTKVAKPNGQV